QRTNLRRNIRERASASFIRTGVMSCKSWRRTQVGGRERRSGRRNNDRIMTRIWTTGSDEIRRKHKKKESGIYPPSISFPCSSLSSSILTNPTTSCIGTSKWSHILSSTDIATVSFFAIFAIVEEDIRKSSRRKVLFLPFFINVISNGL